jgi:hypothetical protein
MVLPGLGPLLKTELILNLADKEGAHAEANIRTPGKVVQATSS